MVVLSFNKHFPLRFNEVFAMWKWTLGSTWTLENTWTLEKLANTHTIAKNPPAPRLNADIVRIVHVNNKVKDTVVSRLKWRMVFVEHSTMACDMWLQGTRYAPACLLDSVVFLIFTWCRRQENVQIRTDKNQQIKHNRVLRLTCCARVARVILGTWQMKTTWKASASEVHDLSLQIILSP